MKVNALLTILTVSFFFTLAACQKKDDNSSADKSDGPKQYTGDLYQAYSELFKEENTSKLYSCDVDWKTRILEIAAVLEAKRTAINDFAIKNNSGGDGNTKLVTYGKYSFVLTEQINNTKDEWLTDDYSWNGFYSYYQKIKDQPINISWVKLNSAARGIYMNDKARIYGQHPKLNRINKELVLGLNEKVNKFNSEDAFLNIQFTSDEENFINQSKTLSGYLYYSKNSSDKNMKWKYWVNFVTRLSYDADRYNSDKNPNYKIAENKVIIPMNLSIFENSAVEFISYLQSVWNSVGLIVEIENTSINDNVFQVYVSDTLGGRAFVSYQSKKLQLFNYGKQKTIAHEFGHVIGLPDEYYTAWDNSKCSYTDEYNPANIMSESDTGRVLPQHIEEIKKLYQ